MTKTVESIVEAWLTFQRTPETAPEWRERREDALKFSEICANEPESAWEAIITITQRETDDDILGVLAAWPLEDLLSLHGEDFIERVETEAQRDPRFRRVLEGVWQDRMSDDVWKRVLAALDRSSQ